MRRSFFLRSSCLRCVGRYWHLAAMRGAFLFTLSTDNRYSGDNRSAARNDHSRQTLVTPGGLPDRVTKKDKRVLAKESSSAITKINIFLMRKKYWFHIPQ